MTAAEEMRTIREGLGMTQAEFATALSADSPDVKPVHFTTIHRWENGARAVNTSALALARRLRDEHSKKAA
jgi:DNA-binding transcriptional regulator YiaG